MDESKVVKVAVFGASSQIGQALLPRLASAGYSVSRIGRQNSHDLKSITTHVFDKSSSSFGPELESVDAIICLAPLPTIDVVIVMAKILKAKRIIAFGSMSRFSKIGSTSIIEQKFAAEQERAEVVFSIECEAAGIGWTLFRPTMIYGAGSDQNVSFIRSIIRKFRFFPIPIGANGLRQPVHVNDLADACLSALRCKNTINRAYNLGGSERLSYPTFVKKVFYAEGIFPLLVPIPKTLFFLLIAVIKKSHKADFIRIEMVERMYQDLIADNQQAIDDFDYAPRPFSLGKHNSD